MDDDPSLLAACQRLLRRQFALDVAVGAEEGLASIGRQGPYAVVVSDMSMPGMDGLRFLSEVRTVAPETVRLLLTGNAGLPVVKEAVDEGLLFGCLTKPCEPDVLAETLRAGIAQYRQARRAEP